MIEYFQTIISQCKDPIFLIAQILGFVPVILGFFVFSDRSRKGSISIKVFADLFASVHFALLSQWTGCAVCLVNTIRGVLFAQRERKSWASGMHMPIIFCILSIIASAIGWTGPESLLPMLGSCLAIIGYWSLDTRRLRMFNLAGISLWLVYAVAAFSVSMVINNSAYILSILRTEWSLHRKNKKKTNEA